MISPDKVEQVRQLLTQGRSAREIAAAAGVSRGTVGGIATGKRPDRIHLRSCEDELDEPLGPAGRCPECGGRVYLPCRLCRVRGFARSLRQRHRHVA